MDRESGRYGTVGRYEIPYISIINLHTYLANLPTFPYVCMYVGEQVAIFGSLDSKVYAVVVKTGKLKWAYQTQG